MTKKEMLKEKPLEELKALKQRVAELEALVATYYSDEKSNEFENGQKYRAIFESTNDVMLLIDKHGKITDVNKRLKDISGYEREELVGKNITSLARMMTKKKLAVVLSSFLKRMVGVKILPYEVEMIKKSGESIIMEISAQPLMKNDEIIGDLVILRDVSEGKQVEEALKTSEQNFRNLMDNSTMGIRIRDADEYVVYCNQALLDIFGYKNIDELRASPPQDHYTPASYAGYLLRKEKISRDEPVSNTLEVDIKRKDGTIRSLRVFGKSVLWNGKTQTQTFYNDITERKQAEEALKVSEQNFRNSMDNTLVGIRISDIENKTLYANQALLDIFGYKNIDEVIAKSPQEYYSPESYTGYLEMREKYGRGEKMPDQVDIDIVRKDGTLRHLQAFFKIVLWDGKQQYQTLYNDITERKQAEEVLTTSEQNLHNSLDNLPMGFRITDVDDNTLYLNQAFLNIFGYENADEVKRRPPLKDFYTAESYADYLRRKEKLLRGEPPLDKVEVDIVRKDGVLRHLQLSTGELVWDGKQQFQTLYNDVTERKKIEEALWESEEKYRLIVENSSDIIFTLNSVGEFIYVSPSVKKILGYDQEDMLGLPFRSLVHPDDLYVINKAIQSHHLDGVQITENDEYRFRHASGEWRWIVSTGTPMREKDEKVFNFIGIARDITERKQTEEKLEQAAQEWRSTFDSITDLISIHDKDNRIVRVNKAVADTLKTTPKELIGKYCHEVMHGTKEPPANCPHLQTLKTGKPAVIETLRPNLDAYFHESSLPLLNDKGEITGSIIVTRDVTQQKRIEEQLIMTDRLASIGELSSGIAHELNNPLTSVIGFSQLLMEGDVPENIKEDLSIVYREAQRAAVIVKNLLTFARKHAPVKELCQVNTIIEDVLRLRIYEQNVNNIEVEKHLAANLPGIMIDYFQMQQVFLNIIVNAEFAMLEAHHKGRLIITTEKVDGNIRISFGDDGSGISEENMKYIFDPFFTTKEVGKGTGLGLSICHGVVIEHRGTIYARSEKGQGATFIVELPLNG